MSWLPRINCVQCGNDEGQDRYSLGIFYSRLCDDCWRTCRVRKEGPEGFDPLDAGETYEDADNPSALD